MVHSCVEGGGGLAGRFLFMSHPHRASPHVSLFPGLPFHMFLFPLGSIAGRFPECWLRPGTWLKTFLYPNQTSRNTL